LLTLNENWTDVDPQRVFTPEDIAFFSSTLYRSLVTYASSPDAIEGTTLLPDLAIDLGTPIDGGRTWMFALRDGISWEYGSPLICEDISYGVSRTFAREITGGGPAYAIRYLDIPMDDDGVSAYPGPYRATRKEQALFDAVVACDRDTITFRLNQPLGDFNDMTTLGMSPVPNPVDHPGVDIGEGYGISPDSKPWSSGPYRVASYEPGVGGTMVLVRNEHWNRDTDPVRTAYPDRWVVELGLDPREIDQRLMAPEGDDEFALLYGEVHNPENLSRIFADAHTPKPAFEGRVVSAFDPYSSYYWVDTEKVPNEKIRQAIGVALDRQGLRDVWSDFSGGPAFGDFYGDFADGVVKPNIGLDYTDTGYYEDLLGFPIPLHGDPEAAARLIAESGEPAPTLEWNTPESQIGQLRFNIIKTSLEKAGFKVEYGGIPPSTGFCVVCLNNDPRDYVTGEFGTSAWGFDWPSASTVIPALFTEAGGWNLARVQDADFEAGIQNAMATLDRPERATRWQALNREAVERGWIIPTFFTRSQVMAGTKVGPIYRWPAYASWPYGVMYVAE
jgi:peptide/nickel transport system substrate-binding protein